jgi:hypothetical protein
MVPEDYVWQSVLRSPANDAAKLVPIHSARAVGDGTRSAFLPCHVPLLGSLNMRKDGTRSLQTCRLYIYHMHVFTGGAESDECDNDVPQSCHKASSSRTVMSYLYYDSNEVLPFFWSLLASLLDTHVMRLRNTPLLVS